MSHWVKCDITGLRVTPVKVNNFILGPRPFQGKDKPLHLPEPPNCSTRPSPTAQCLTSNVLLSHTCPGADSHSAWSPANLASLIWVENFCITGMWLWILAASRWPFTISGKMRQRARTVPGKYNMGLERNEKLPAARRMKVSGPHSKFYSSLFHTVAVTQGAQK